MFQFFWLFFFGVLRFFWKSDKRSCEWRTFCDFLWIGAEKLVGVFFWKGNWAPKLKGEGRTIIFTMQKVKQKRQEIQILYKVHPAKCRIQSDALETCLFLARNSILILSLHFLLVRTIAFLSGPFFFNFGGNFDFFCVFFCTVFYLFFWLVCR